MAGRIPMVDDEPTIRDMIGFALSRAGYSYVEAADAVEAEAEISRQLPWARKTNSRSNRRNFSNPKRSYCRWGCEDQTIASVQFIDLDHCCASIDYAQFDDDSGGSDPSDEAVLNMERRDI